MNEKENPPRLTFTWQTVKFILFVIKWPLLAIIISYGVYFSAAYFLREEIHGGLYIALQIIVAICIYWIFLKSLTYIRLQLKFYIEKTQTAPYKNSFFLLDFFLNVSKIIFFLILCFFIIDLLPLPEPYTYFADRALSILVIIAVTAIFIRVVKLIEEIIAAKYNVYGAEDLLAQKVRTQMLVLGRIANTLIIIIAIGAILLLFESVRNLGTSILTSAGIISILAGFAVQRPLKNLADSLQIIFNQLIKINDLIVIEKETGTVEEINLSYVVIKIWDLRRLIVPINYFVEKSFINLSRTSTDILSIIKLYVDYTLPVEEIRKYLKTIVAESLYWDKKMCNLFVIGATESAMELRIDLSALTPGDAWNLQCEIREKLLQFIRENYPQSLPHVRNQLQRYTD